MGLASHPRKEERVELVMVQKLFKHMLVTYFSNHIFGTVMEGEEQLWPLRILINTHRNFQANVFRHAAKQPCPTAQLDNRTKVLVTARRNGKVPGALTNLHDQWVHLLYFGIVDSKNTVTRNSMQPFNDHLHLGFICCDPHDDPIFKKDQCMKDAHPWITKLHSSDIGENPHDTTTTGELACSDSPLESPPDLSLIFETTS